MNPIYVQVVEVEGRVDPSPATDKKPVKTSGAGRSLLFVRGILGILKKKQESKPKDLGALQPSSTVDDRIVLPLHDAGGEDSPGDGFANQQVSMFAVMNHCTVPYAKATTVRLTHRILSQPNLPYTCRSTIRRLSRLRELVGRSPSFEVSLVSSRRSRSPSLRTWMHLSHHIPSWTIVLYCLSMVWEGRIVLEMALPTSRLVQSCYESLYCSIC